VFFQKIVVLDSVIFFPEHRRRLEAIAGSIVEYNTCSNEDQVSERCLGADGIISCWVDIPRRIIDENPQLKTVAFWTHDYEHRIDVGYAQERGVFVPAIPDYGTDSVAELVLIGLLALSGREAPAAPAGAAPGARSLAEEIVFRFADDIRCFSSNVKDALGGRWYHEYVKTGQLRIDSPDGIPGETLKGMTVGLLGPELTSNELVDIVSRGLRMNLVYGLADGPHSLDATYRPVDDLLAESQILVYDSRSLATSLKARIEAGAYLSRVDVAELDPQRRPLQGRRLGIIGLGRIGSRVG
jgi:lactate dehydrogenase-like 2-hydroxyacid dehydrogenase